MTLYDIAPVAKPRMTRSDKWKQRPPVMAYWRYKDQCKGAGVEIPASCKITFNIKCPDSWSPRRKMFHYGMPHQQKPDIDNLIKGLLDAVLEDDAYVWKIQAEKIWANHNCMEIEELT